MSLFKKFSLNLVTSRNDNNDKNNFNNNDNNDNNNDNDNNDDKIYVYRTCSNKIAIGIDKNN